MSEESEERIAQCRFCGENLDVSGIEPFSRLKCPACSAEILVPRWLRNLVLLEPLGGGGMAQVYRGHDLTLDRTVAVKIPFANMNESSQFVQDFLEEARAAAAVNHPHVVSIFSCDVEDGEPFLVMEYMGGGSVDKLLDEYDGAPLEEKTAINYILQTARGLDAAYRQGVVHHDVKPGNMLLDKDGQLKVTDFGLAQLLQRGQDYTSSKKAVWGSPYYMSPERAAKKPDDYRGDMFSLGVTLYHLLAGKPPYDDEDTTNLIHARLKYDPPSLKKVNPDISAGTEELVSWLMEREISDRPQSYREVISHLLQINKGFSRKKGKVTTGKKQSNAALHRVREKATHIHARKTASAASVRERRLKRTFNWLILLGLIGLALVFAGANKRDSLWFRRLVTIYEQVTPGWMNPPVKESTDQEPEKPGDGNTDGDT